VLAPVHDPGSGPLPYAAADPVRSVNDDSLVIAVERAGRRVLFLGDIEREGEDRLVASPIELASDVVKVAHHGSATSSSPALVAATHPGLAVISLARGNRFAFPAAEVVARWQAVGAAVLRTDQAGAITVVVDAAGVVTVTTLD
jgi:competence protein ComEC